MVSHPGVWAGILTALQLVATGIAMVTLSPAQRELAFGKRWNIVLAMALLTGAFLLFDVMPVAIVAAQLVLALACGVRNTTQWYDPYSREYDIVFALMHACGASTLGVAVAVLV